VKRHSSLVTSHTLHITLYVLRSWPGARPDADAQFLADQFKFWLTAGVETREPDNETGYTGADGAHIAQLCKQGGDGAVAFGVDAELDVVQGDRIGQASRTADFDAVGKEKEPDLRAAQAVIAVGDGIDTASPSALRS
jgi:hypothetical protein